MLLSEWPMTLLRPRLWAPGPDRSFPTAPRGCVRECVQYVYEDM